jgi:hypothetical protein
MTKPPRKTTEPLRTRHVFLDTEVYRRAGFNISNTPFALLAKDIEAGRFALHVCDITLAEIHRQLRETVIEKAAEAKRLARDFNRIAQISGRQNSTVNEVDGLNLAEAAWAGFIEVLLGKRFRSHSILALDVPARLIFDRYFAGSPPFDDRSSKEFPDAFVVEGLARYCESNEIMMYVVSGDAALRRAAESRDALIPLQTIDEVLAAATAESGADLEAIVDDVFASPGFDQQLTEAIEGDLDFVDFIYYGPLRMAPFARPSWRRSSISMTTMSRRSTGPRSGLSCKHLLSSTRECVFSAKRYCAHAGSHVECGHRAQTLYR